MAATPHLVPTDDLVARAVPVPASPMLDAPTRSVSRAATMLGAVTAHLRLPLFRSSYALIASGIISTGLGLGFWALAVHFYPPEEIGRTSAAISMMTLLAVILQFNLTTGLIRFLPRAGRRTGPLLAKAYAVALGMGLIGATLFAVVVSGHLFLGAANGSTLAFAAVFVLAVPVWSVFAMQDAALTGLRAATVVPVENAIFAAAKIVLLVPFAVFPREGLLLAWIVPAAMLVVPVNLYVFKRLVPARRSETAEIARWGEARRYLAPDYAGGLLEAGFVACLPVLVTWKLGLVDNAYFYTSWMVVTGLEMLLFALGSSLTVEGAHDRNHAARLHKSSVRLAAALLGPVVVIGLIAAPALLGVYGASYTEHSTTLFRLLLVAMPLRACVILRMSVLRVERKGGAVMVYQASNAVLLAIGGALFLGPFGLTGLGVVFLITQALLAAVVGISGLRQRARRSTS